MTDFINVTVLAILQGVAEFLPISSSGHLVIGQHFLGIKEAGMRLDTMLHLGTVFAIFLFYRTTILGILKGLTRKDAWIFIGKLVLSAIPAVIVYGIFKEHIDSLFQNAKMVGALLMFTGATLVITKYLPKGEKDVSWKNALFMGLTQSIALLPGVSRSGTTLTASRMCGIAPEKAAEFSFLMSTPLILGGVLLEVIDSVTSSTQAETTELSWSLLLWGAALAAIVGYFSLMYLVRTLKGHFFWLFGPYCFLAGLLTLIFT